MKKTNLYAALIAIFILISCQKDASQEDVAAVSTTQKDNWLTANLDAKFASSQKQVKSYVFSSQEFSELNSTPNLHHLRFVLGYENGIINIDAVGVNAKGKEVSRIKSKVSFAFSDEDKLANLNQVTVDITKKRSATLNKHLLSPKTAFSGIEAWQSKLDKVQDLNEITSYDNLRIQHYGLETEVINTIINKSGVVNVGLFLGLNNEGKLTTIFVGLDKDNNVKTSSPTSKEVDGVYDFTEPSPPGVAGDN